MGQPVSGHVFRYEGKRRPTWRAKYRLPDGRQVKKTIGPAWTGRGRPPAGYYTKRTAEDWLREILSQARAGVLPGMVRTGVTVSDAAAEYLRWLQVDRQRKPSTLQDYRSVIRAHLLPAFGDTPVEELTPEAIERWLATVPVSNRTKAKILAIFGGVLERARRLHRLPRNPVRDVEKPQHAMRCDLDVFSPEEVWALVRAAESPQDAAIFLTAAFTGLRRGELVALCWRDVDFAAQRIRVRHSYSGGQVTTPKSGKLRSVPLASDVASAIANLSRRELFTDDDDLVFPGVAGEWLDASALSRRYKTALGRAGLRPLRFHDLRHTFGTRAITKADIRRVQEWMGHADIATTMRYLHYVEHPGEAELISAVFAVGRESFGQLERDELR
jgi:integrase